MGFLKRSFNEYIKCYYVLGTNLKIYHYFFKALYYTGNRSVALATNWIFDHPELDLETPLEEEMRRLEAEEEEAFDEDDEDEDSEEERLMQHHHHQQMLQQQRRVQQQSRIQHHQHHYWYAPDFLSFLTFK